MKKKDLSVGDFATPDFGIWDRAKRNFWTAMVWVLLACIPVTWFILYRQELKDWWEKNR